MTKHVEIKTVEHKGIKVVVKIDYINGKASLVELLQANGEVQTPAKKWVFAERGLEYMDSWIIILEAMTVAVKECKKDLEFSLAQSSAFKEEMADRMLGLMQEVGKEYKKSVVSKKRKPIVVKKNLFKGAKFDVKVNVPKKKK